MVDAQIDRRAYGSTPIIKALPRRTVNQIHTGTHADSICHGDSCRHIGRSVRTIQYFQHTWHGRLHAERDAVESAVRQFFHIIGVHRVRIRFGGDFRVLGNAPRIAHGIQHGHQIRGFQNRGRATAEKDGGRFRFVNAVRDLPIANDRHLANHHVGVVAARCARPHVDGGIRVEITITAATHAEWHMNVDFEHQPSVF